MSKKVAIQGQAASFHDIATRQFFGDDIAFRHCDTFSETFQALADNTVDHAVVAIENSLFGSINKVYDLLLTHKFWIIGEVYLRIEQCLIGLPGADIRAIIEVHSQLEALAQCEEYLDMVLPQAARFEQHDTAASVADVKKWGDPSKAAIASRAAAELHDMEILASEIETNKQNYTRFVVLAKSEQPVKAANKTSLVLTTRGDTKPGALYRALGAFAKHSINLTMLQSRPVVGKAWHYLFYVDMGISMHHEHFQSALTELSDLGYHTTVLGCYQNGLL